MNVETFDKVTQGLLFFSLTIYFAAAEKALEFPYLWQACLLVSCFCLGYWMAATVADYRDHRAGTLNGRKPVNAKLFLLAAATNFGGLYLTSTSLMHEIGSRLAEPSKMIFVTVLFAILVFAAMNWRAGK